MNLEKLTEILLSDKPSFGIVENEEEVFKLIPELRVCKGFNQNNDWHIYDVYHHILHVIDNTPKDLTLRLAALFHDLGKPLTYKEDRLGVGHFYGHWIESEKIFKIFALKNNLDSKLAYEISNLIYYHDAKIPSLNWIELDEMLNTFTDEGLDKLYLLKKADLLAQNSKYHSYLFELNDEKEKIKARHTKITNIVINDDNLAPTDIDEVEKNTRAILLYNDKILICNYSGVSNLPGGTINKGESISDAIIRELISKTGYKYDINELEPFIKIDYYQKNNPTDDNDFNNRLITTYYYIGKYKGINYDDIKLTNEEKINNYSLSLVDTKDFYALLNEKTPSLKKEYFNKELEEVIKVLKK